MASLNVVSSTQRIEVSASSGTVSIMYTGPVGPVGPAGPIGPIGPMGPTGPRRTVRSVVSQAFNPLLTDENTMLLLSATAPVTIILPPDSLIPFPNGAEVDFAWWGSAAVTTFVADSGATANGTPGLKLRAQYSAATAKKVAANTWLVIGDLTA